MDLNRECKILSLSFRSIRIVLRKLTEEGVIGNFRKAAASVP